MRKSDPRNSYLSFLLLCAFSTTGASESPEKAIAKCRQADEPAVRIACLEAALRGEAPHAGPSRDAASDAEPPAPVLDTWSADEPDKENVVDIGRTQVEARNLTREQQLARLESARDLQVASYSEVPYQRIVVHLENGQVWRQLAGDNQYFRVSLERNQTVDISESSLGGFQLRFNQMRRTIRVERIE